MSPGRPRRSPINPRLVVLGVLLVSYAWALVFPLRLSRPPSTPLATAFVVGLALFGCALALVLRAAGAASTLRGAACLEGLVEHVRPGVLGEPQATPPNRPRPGRTACRRRLKIDPG